MLPKRRLLDGKRAQNLLRRLKVSLTPAQNCRCEKGIWAPWASGRIRGLSCVGTRCALLTMKSCLCSWEKEQDKLDVCS